MTWPQAIATAALTLLFACLATAVIVWVCFTFTGTGLIIAGVVFLFILLGILAAGLHSE